MWSRANSRNLQSIIENESNVLKILGAKYKSIFIVMTNNRINLK